MLEDGGKEGGGSVTPHVQQPSAESLQRRNLEARLNLSVKLGVGVKLRGGGALGWRAI